MKAGDIIGPVALVALSTFVRPAMAANWAIDNLSCYGNRIIPLEVERALNIAKHVANNLVGDNYDTTIQNFVQVLFNQAPDGVGLQWVQDVFAGQGPENLPGIANFESRIDDDDVVAGDLVSLPISLRRCTSATP